MAQILKTDGTIVEVQPKNNGKFELKELQEIVNGCIDIVTLDGKLLVVNDEGILDGLEFNHKATQIALEYFSILYNCKPSDLNYGLVGDILYCDDNEID